jgi:D-alanyl-D-alanine carboxypeptidase
LRGRRWRSRGDNNSSAPIHRKQRLVLEFFTFVCDDCAFSLITRSLGELGVAVKDVEHQRGGFRGGAMRAPRTLALTLAIMALCIVCPGGAEAGRHVHYHHTRLATVGFAPSPVGESIVLDADTGRVLSEANADAITYPASLTKMMTLYLTFEALNTGRLRLDQLLPVSLDAASKSPTKLGLRPGDAVAVQDLIYGIVTRSANDAAAVLAEGLGGSEPGFADLMNRKAQQLGMRNTYYRNASGLPDPLQHTTARDTAQLALALYHDFPREYRFFATRSFVFRGVTIVGHDHLLDWYPGADGIKTGYIRASGFNLATSAVRDGHRLVGVVLGGTSGGSRDREMAALLDQGFAALGVAPMTVAAHRALPVAAAPAPIVAPSAPTAAMVATATAETAAPAPMPAHARAGLFSKAALRLAAHLSPVAKAEAATLPPQPPRPALASERWGIQLGAFHAPAAAERAAHNAASVSFARGKPVQIVAPAKTGKERWYRARLLNFTPREAQGACAQLRKKGIECSVISPAMPRVAAR